MIPFGLTSLMTVSLPIARRASKCLVPGASAIWLCNDGSGTTLRDYSGNGNDGTFGAAGAAPSWGAAGVVFVDNDTVTFPTITLTGAFTVIYVADRTDTAGSDVVLGMNGTNIKFGWESVTTDVLIRVINAGSSEVSVAAPDSGTAPHAYAVVRGADDKVDLSIDGAAFARLFADAAQSGTMTLDRFVNQANDRLTGTVYFAAIYPFALTAAQVAQTYAAIRGILAPRGVTLP